MLAMDAAQVERLIFRAAAPIVHSVAALTQVQRGELLPNVVRVMLAAFLDDEARARGDRNRLPHDGGKSDACIELRGAHRATNYRLTAAPAPSFSDFRNSAHRCPGR